MEKKRVLKYKELGGTLVVWIEEDGEQVADFDLYRGSGDHIAVNGEINGEVTDAEMKEAKKHYGESSCWNE